MSNLLLANGAQGCERHKWVEPRGRNKRERVSQSFWSLDATPNSPRRGCCWSRWSDQHASWMILCFAHDVLVLVSKPSPLLSPICGRLRICFPSSDTPGPWRLVSKRAVQSNASYRAAHLVRTVGLWP